MLSVAGLLKGDAMIADKTGQIVWHDLFTDDACLSKSFYKRVAGWHYVTEHATDFAWGGGEKDFILALSGDEAGTGFVEHHDRQATGWIPYVEVLDVDATAVLAQDFGGTVEKAAFEVPGVGRNCLLRDPLGALVGICLSRHTFPRPTKQFGTERYITQSKEFPARFYKELFAWSVLRSNKRGIETQSIILADAQIGSCVTIELHSDTQALWVPGIRVKCLSRALQKVESLRGSIISSDRFGSNEDYGATVSDPNGAHSYLVME
ncbi:MAG: VOC family protein [Pseudomonadota bacterium]